MIRVRRYHAETPELFVPQMVFTARRRSAFLRRHLEPDPPQHLQLKHEQKGQLEAKVKSFCDRRTC